MKDIKGFEGLYAITSCGKVWSYRNKKCLKPYKQSKGYLAVSLYKDGTQKKYNIHRLVAEAYLPNPNNLPQVNHKDENKTHNYINNLEWCDNTYNVNYGTRNKRVGRARSKTVICVETNIVYYSPTEVEQTLGIDASSIHKCCKGKRHTAGGYHWRYDNE